MKQRIIFKHGGGELANQLWNYVSVYAYGLATGAKVKNPSFFEYHAWFRLASEENVFVRLMTFIAKRSRGRRNSFLRKGLRRTYSVYVKFVEIFRHPLVFSSENTTGEITYLPPTKPLPPETEQSAKLYFKGWLFRNPAGLRAHRKALLEAFSPIPEICENVDKIVSPLRTSYSHVVGVHVRQDDYAIFKDGRYLVSQKRVREILDEYLQTKGLAIKDTVFVITSDGKVDKAQFEGLNIHISNEAAVTDLFLLSKTDCVLGSDSSFGAFAAWYGDVPHIIFKNEPMDWAYYNPFRSFFENKYCLLLRL